MQRYDRGGFSNGCAILLTGLCWGAVTAPAQEAATKDILSPAEIRKAGIVSVLEKTIRLRAVVSWEYSTIKIPEDPRTADELARQAGPLRVAWGASGFEDIKERQRHVRAEGGALRKGRDAEGREIYAVDKTDFVNGKEYVLWVRIHFRTGFGHEMLQNPAFVKQCENPTYWSQTFEVEILSVE